jgi:hypothetical protein
MHQSELTELMDCVECGSTVDPAIDRAFAITPEAVLCYACCLRRGGEFDGTREKWVVAPRLDGLPGLSSGEARA